MESKPCRILVLGPEKPQTPPGLELLWFPLIKIVGISGCSLILISTLKDCEAIAFTSPRGPYMLAEDARKQGVYNILRREMSKKIIAVVGPSTALSLKKAFGLVPHLIPEKYTSKELAFTLMKIKPNCVVLARSAKGVRDLPSILSSNNISYREIKIYDEVVDFSILGKIGKLLSKVDVIILSSPLMAKVFCSTLKLPRSLKLVAIGPTTAKSIRENCSINNVKLPETYTYSSALDLAAKLCRE